MADSLCMPWTERIWASRVREICTHGLKRAEAAGYTAPPLLDCLIRGSKSIDPYPDDLYCPDSFPRLVALVSSRGTAAVRGAGASELGANNAQNEVASSQSSFGGGHVTNAESSAPISKKFLTISRLLAETSVAPRPRAALKSRHHGRY